MASQALQLDRFVRARHTSRPRTTAKRAYARLLRRDWKRQVVAADVDDMGAPAIGFAGWVS